MFVKTDNIGSYSYVIAKMQVTIVFIISYINKIIIAKNEQETLQQHGRNFNISRNISHQRNLVINI